MQEIKYFPGHYAAMSVINHETGDNKSRLIDDRKWAFITNTTNNYKQYFTGIHTQMYWRDMEGPNLGQFDQGIEKVGIALDRAKAEGLRMTLEFQDRAFGIKTSVINNNRVIDPSNFPQPVYMRNNIAYGNGGNDNINGSHYLGNPRGGSTYSLMPRLWNDAVVERMIALFEKYGEAFNTHSAFAGWHLEETALNDAPSDTVKHSNTAFPNEERQEAFVRLQRDIYASLATSFPNCMVMQICNVFPPVMTPVRNATTGIWTAGRLPAAQVDALNKYAIGLGIGFSGPDSVQRKPGGVTTGRTGCMDGPYQFHHEHTMPDQLKKQRVAEGWSDTHYPIAIQHQRPSMRVSTSEFGVGVLTVAKVGANAEDAGNRARGMADRTRKLNPEGHLWYCVDKLKAGYISWDLLFLDLEIDPPGKPGCRPDFWRIGDVCEMLKRVATGRPGNKPPFMSTKPHTVTVRENGEGPPSGDYNSPTNFVVADDELTWTWTHSTGDLRRFEITAGSHKVKVGKNVRSIAISALKLEDGGVDVSLQAVSTSERKSSVLLITFEPESLSPPTKVCVTSTEINWEYDLGQHTGFNVYIDDELVSSTGPGRRKTALPSGLGTTQRTVAVRTVTKFGLSEAKELQFTPPESKCTSSVVGPPDCTNPRNAACPYPRMKGTPLAIMDTHQATHERFATALNLKKYDIVMLGDSITGYWTRAGIGLAAWNASDSTGFSLSTNGYNAGIGGDQVQNILYRIKGGQPNNTAKTTWNYNNAKRYFALRKHKTVVLCAGINNTWLFSWNDVDDNNGSATMVANGLTNIINEILVQSPTTKILLVAILPNGAVGPDSRAKLVNAKLATAYGNNQVANVRYLDPRLTFANSLDNGDIKGALYGVNNADDTTHINAAGYVQYANLIRPILKGWLT